MQKTKLRKFIFLSVAFHVVVISAILLYLYLNPLPSGKSGTVMVGVISGSTNKTSNSDSDTDDLKQVKKTESKEEQSLTKKTVKKNIKTDTALVKRNSKEQTQQEAVQKQKKEAGTSQNSKKSQNSLDTNKNTSAKGIQTASNRNERNPGQGQDFGSGSASANTELAYPDYNINPKPKYPRTARKRGYQGEVELKVFVLENGKVGKIEIIRPSGYKILDESALEAVKNWVFIPGKQNGKEISSWVTVPINFQLKSG